MSCWPRIHLKKVCGIWYATAKDCNVVGAGKTPREAYDDWYWWFKVPV